MNEEEKKITATEDDGFVDEEPKQEIVEEAKEEPVEEVNPNEDEFLDEHPIEPTPVEEAPQEEEKEEEKPEEEDIPKRPKLASYEYDDDRLASIETSRVIWNKGYRKTSMIKMVLSIIVLAIIIAGWIVPTLVLKDAGPTPLYVALGIAAVGIGVILIFGMVQKKKDRAGIDAYFTAFYNAINSYVFEDIGVQNISGTYADKVAETEVEACGLYPGFAQVGSRDNITFTYQNMDCAIADMAVQKNASRGLQTVFVGKFLRTHNTLEVPGEEKLILYFKGNSRAIPPLVIEEMKPIEETKTYAIYGPESAKKALTHRVRTALNQIRTDALLVDVAISIESGRTYWLLGYEDDLMVLPNRDAFDPYYVQEYKGQIHQILDIALMMNESKE